VFQTLILLTGNYNFFNLLSMLLCIFLFDDAALRHLVPQRVASWVQRQAPRPRLVATTVATVLALVIVPIGLNRIWETFTRTDLPVLGAISRAVSPLFIVNPYGLFAVMTTARPEIVIDGSADGETWTEFVFAYKPGPLTRPPLWNIPLQPRLDWQLWFAALGDAQANPWIQNFVLRLLQGSPSVLALLDSNPFPGRPARFVRAKLYMYRFTDFRTRSSTGQWWVRELERTYFPRVSLSDFGQTAGSDVAPSGELSTPKSTGDHHRGDEEGRVGAGGDGFRLAIR
jgi:Lipase maturation factor